MANKSRNKYKITQDIKILTSGFNREMGKLVEDII